MSTSPYRTAVTGTSVAKVFNGCGLSTHNTEHHNWGNCQRRTHPEFKSQEHVAYANSTAGWAATTRRAATGLPDLLHIDKTYSAPNNNVAAAGFDCGGGRGSRGRDGPGNKATAACTPCLTTSYIASLSLKSDTDLIPMLFKVAEAGEAAEAGIGNSKLINTLIDTGSLGLDGNYIHTDLVKAFAKRQIMFTDSVCSGLDSARSSNMKYIFLTVNVSNPHVFPNPNAPSNPITPEIV